MVGVDVVNISRLRAALERSPRLERRLFTEAERTYCGSQAEPVVHLAGTLAAKEAVIKALRLGSLVAWARRIEVDRDDSGVPTATVDGGRRVEVSIAHDEPVAVAVAVVGDVAHPRHDGH